MVVFIVLYKLADMFMPRYMLKDFQLSLNFFQILFSLQLGLSYGLADKNLQVCQLGLVGIDLNGGRHIIKRDSEEGSIRNID
jgi:hypothetical protein